MRMLEIKNSYWKPYLLTLACRFPTRTQTLNKWMMKMMRRMAQRGFCEVILHENYWYIDTTKENGWDFDGVNWGWFTPIEAKSWRLQEWGGESLKAFYAKDSIPSSSSFGGIYRRGSCVRWCWRVEISIKPSLWDVWDECVW